MVMAALSSQQKQHQQRQKNEQIEKSLFRVLLHDLLDDSEKNDESDIVAWAPSGRCFKVHHKQKFMAKILPRFFKQSKYKSFVRQLNIWGFSCISQGPDKGYYFHTHFVKGKKELCKGMVREKIKGTSPPRGLLHTTTTPTSPPAAVSSSTSSPPLSSCSAAATTATTTATTGSCSMRSTATNKAHAVGLFLCDVVDHSSSFLLSKQLAPASSAPATSTRIIDWFLPPHHLLHHHHHQQQEQLQWMASGAGGGAAAILQHSPPGNLPLDSTLGLCTATMRMKRTTTTGMATNNSITSTTNVFLIPEEIEANSHTSLSSYHPHDTFIGGSESYRRNAAAVFFHSAPALSAYPTSQFQGSMMMKNAEWNVPTGAADGEDKNNSSSSVLRTLQQKLLMLCKERDALAQQHQQEGVVLSPTSTSCITMNQEEHGDGGTNWFSSVEKNNHRPDVLLEDALFLGSADNSIMRGEESPHHDRDDSEVHDDDLGLLLMTAEDELEPEWLFEPRPFVGMATKVSFLTDL